ncbi:MAG: crossover junction endodeoxyribonuclease RuvC [Anaerolineales bacterium]|nr:crossover junction endodeoxyribonuclease RuvC [Anaerolineales bacterium]
MLVIGVDPGTASTGYGLLRQHRDGQLDLIDFGMISTTAGKPMATRLLDLYQVLTEIIDNFQPDAAAVEKLYFQRNVSTAITVGQARGVAMLALAQVGIPIEEYSPKEIKVAVTGYGNADKGQMQSMVKVLLRMEDIPKPDDAADALAVAICHCHSQKLRSLGGHS